MKYSKLAVELIVALLMVLLIYTGLSKLMDSATFKSQLDKSPFIQPMAGLIAVILPYGELLLTILLMYSKTRLIALYISFGLMLLFTGYVVLMLNFAYDLPCSCGGALSKLSWTDHIWFNSAFVILSIIAILLETNILFRKEVIT